MCGHTVTYHADMEQLDYVLTQMPNDAVEFRHSFTLESKSETDQVVTELEDGDLIIEGMAATFSGIDRQDENFVPGAFQRATKAFVSGSSPLCFHHKRDHILGRVLEREEVEGKGLRMKARVDGALRTHPVLGTIYQQIKNGTISALSVGGYFKRGMVGGRQMITDMDLVEISATATPVMANGTSFLVVAGKALQSPEPEQDLTEVSARIDQLAAIFELLSKRPLV